jgi:RNA polymerase sigma factor (sigma-70 family)
MLTDYETADTADLVRAVQDSNDSRAFEALCNRSYRNWNSIHWKYSRMLPASQHEDLWQSGLMYVLRAVRTANPERIDVNIFHAAFRYGLSSYTEQHGYGARNIYGALNQHIDQVSDEDGTVQSFLDTLSDDSLNPEQALIVAQEHLILRNIIDSLPEPEKSIMLLYLEDTSLRHIANTLNLGDFYVRKLVPRILHSIKCQLIEQGVRRLPSQEHLFEPSDHPELGNISEYNLKRRRAVKEWRKKKGKDWQRNYRDRKKTQ